MNEPVRPIAIAASVMSAICAVVLLSFAMIAVVLGNATSELNNNQRSEIEQGWFVGAALLLAFASGIAWRWASFGCFLALASVVMMWVLTADEMSDQWPFLALACAPAVIAFIAMVDEYRSIRRRNAMPRDITEGLGKSWLTIR